MNGIRSAMLESPQMMMTIMQQRGAILRSFQQIINPENRTEIWRFNRSYQSYRPQKQKKKEKFTAMSRPWWSMQPPAAPQQTPPAAPQQTVLDPPEGGSSPSGGSHSSGSIGTLVVVLAVITILGVLAGVIARICGGRHLAGNGDYDFEGWVENKCSSCIDGSLGAVNAASRGGEPAEKHADAGATGGDAKTAEDNKPAEGGDKKEEEEKKSEENGENKA
eukprot:Gb_04720 [translate_table: standard]